MLNVLLAVDDSEASRRAAAKIAEMGSWWKADRLDLLNVQPDQAGFGEPLPYAIQQKAEALARAAGARVLEAARAAMTNVSPAAGGVVELGDPATQIAEAAGRLDSTLIALGFHGAGALEALVMGSVTTKVLH
ncbi:MAG: universal stress protein, partial [Casimicrobiaceae bacterium]